MATGTKTVSQRDKLQLAWSQLDSEFSPWRGQYEEITRFIAPQAGRFLVTDRNRGTKRTSAIIDNTATRALRTLGAGMMADVTSPARPWMRIVTGDEVLDRIHAVEVWLAAATKAVLRVCAKSNTYRVLHQTYEALGAFGTGAFLALSHEENVIHCYPLACGEYRLAQDWQGKINCCYRRFQRTVGELVGEFGYDNCSITVQKLYDQGSLNNPVTIVHAIEPRRDRNPLKLDAKNMPYASIYYEEGETSKVLRESGFARFPVIAPRWAVEGSDTYGTGPGMEAIGDVKQLQQEQFRKSQGIDYMSDPPRQMPTSAKDNDTNFLPGGVTFVDGEQGVRPAFQVNLNLDHLLADIQDVRERIRSSFFADLFLMLAMADKTRMTATEVAERHEEKLIQLGPVLERVHTELLEPLVRIIFEELLQRGELPPIPLELAGRELTLEFTSMLAQAQRAVAVVPFERAIGIVGAIAEAKPEVLDNLDEDALWAAVTNMLGVDPAITRDPQKRDKLRAARAQAQAAQAQAAMAEQQSKTAKNLGTTPTNAGTALGDVLSLFSGYDSPPAQAVR